MDKSNALLTTREFAQKAGVSAGTVSKWLRKGTIKGKKINAKWSISAAELAKVNQTPGSPPAPSKQPIPKVDAPAANSATVNRSYSIQEFSDMTYLTPYGVEKWVKEGRLKKTVDAAGQLKIDGSNLDNPDVKRLLR
jgi:predicted site-specific integrase-resolvase